VHGFITITGQKISKSTGLTVDPSDIIEKYGTDAFRYYFLRHIPSYGDGDFSWEKLNDSYNSELANELGNAVQRTAAMITQYQNGIIGKTPEATHDIAQYWEAMSVCRFDRALEEVWEQVRGLNQYIDETKPWEINKRGDVDHLREVLAYQVACLLEIAELLEPFMPETSTKIRHVFEEGVVRPIDGTLFPRIEKTA
jgi:methionyl-tRNA synthetase